MPTSFGYSIGISDIRVTLRDGSEKDCLQKVYPISNSIALGFAGSVRIGFRMVTAMRAWLRCDETNRAWIPKETVELWRPMARDIFASAPSEEQARHCHLIMLSADPDSIGALGATAYVHTFKSPEFVPIEVETNKAAGIGSGTFIEEYAAHLDEISNSHDRTFTLMKGETMNPGGMGGLLGFSLTRMLMRTNPQGISSHLHYCWVYLGKTIIKTNNHATAGAWTCLGGNAGSGINRRDVGEPDRSATFNGATPFQMPRIAESWKELRDTLNASGERPEGSVA
ncbi:MAG TPA: hypothetical protein VMT20_26525 [Terriglobia bacterium]|nr:hypothetical protein [Terriglobia bacterium]